MRVNKLGVMCILAGLTGCVTPDTGTGGASSAQEAAKQICRFVPTAATVLSILKLGLPQLTTAADVATAICEAVAPKTGPNGAKSFPTNPSVAGVPIQGSFVQ